jgi:hypothetical protein
MPQDTGAVPSCLGQGGHRGICVVLRAVPEPDWRLPARVFHRQVGTSAYAIIWHIRPL